MIARQTRPRAGRRRRLALCLTVVAAMALWTVWASAARFAAQSAPHDAVTPFRIAVPDAVLVDLRERLARTRFPDYLRELVVFRDLLDR